MHMGWCIIFVKNFNKPFIHLIVYHYHQEHTHPCPPIVSVIEEDSNFDLFMIVYSRTCVAAAIFAHISTIKLKQKL